MEIKLEQEQIIEIKELMNHVKDKFDKGYLNTQQKFSNEMVLLITTVLDILGVIKDINNDESILEIVELFSNYMIEEVSYDELLLELLKMLGAMN